MKNASKNISNREHAKKKKTDDVWAQTERCCVSVASYPQPPDRGQHGCTVGIDGDPLVWHLHPGRAVEVPERQLLLAWLLVERLLTVVNPLHCGARRLVGQHLHKSDRSQPLSISSIHGLTLFLLQLLLLESFASLEFISFCTAFIGSAFRWSCNEYRVVQSCSPGHRRSSSHLTWH